MGMVHHEPLGDTGAHLAGLGIIHGNAHPVGHGSHAGHHDTSPRVVGVPEKLDRALSAGAHGMQRGMPAEIGEVEPQGEADLEEVLSFSIHLVRTSVYRYGQLFHV